MRHATSARTTLIESFGVQFTRLDVNSQKLVIADVIDLATREDLTIIGAVRTLDRRIGGPINLPNYAKVLEVNAQHRALYDDDDDVDTRDGAATEFGADQ